MPSVLAAKMMRHRTAKWQLVSGLALQKNFTRASFRRSCGKSLSHRKCPRFQTPGGEKMKRKIIKTTATAAVLCFLAIGGYVLKISATMAVGVHRILIGRGTYDRFMVNTDRNQPGLGGQFKSGQLGSFQNRPTEVARNC